MNGPGTIQAGPRLAIVTPTCNRPALVRRLHESLRAQTTVLDWVHIIVDDASETDAGLRNLWPDSKHLVWIQNSKNMGPLVSRNIAIDAAVNANADLIAFVDDDDYVNDSFFPYVKRIWKQLPEVGWYVSRCRYVGADSQRQQRWPDRDGFYSYARDMHLHPKFTSDVSHVVSTERLGNARFSRYGFYQREWTLLSKLARKGDFYASRDCFQVREYLPDGLTRTERGFAPDFIGAINYLQRAFVIVTLEPRSGMAWRRFFRQLLALPVRLLVLLARRLGIRQSSNSNTG